MNKYQVFQVFITKEMVAKANREGIESVPELAYNRECLLNKTFDSTNFRYYTHVANVSASDLEDAFKITNLWNEPEKVEFIQRMHSLNVGDILLDESTNKYYIVANFGFDEIFI